MRDADRPVLRRLDDRVVPQLQRGGRRLGRAVTAPFRALNRAEERAGGGAAFRALWPRRQLIVLAAAVLLFVGAFVHMQRFEAVRGVPSAAPGATDVDEVTDDGPVTDAGAATVGPSIGGAIDDHIAEREAELEAADSDARRLAVVSFNGYLDADTVAGIVGEGTLEAQLRVPSEGEEPFRVVVADGDLSEAVAAELERERDRIAAEEEEFRRLLDSGTIEDPEFEAFYEAEIERLAGMRNLLDSGSGTVFAVVLEARVDDLRVLADHEEVRLVDIAPGDVATLEDATFYGLLPDESSSASFGSLD